MIRLSRVMAAIAAWFSRRRQAGVLSRHLSGPEVADFRAQMLAHGMSDEDGSHDEVEESCHEK